MLINEILLERISIAADFNELRSEIDQIVSEQTNLVYQQFDDSDIKLLTNKILTNIESKLKQYISKKILKYSHKPIEVVFTTLEQGTGQYIPDESKLLISKKILINLANLKSSIKLKELSKKNMHTMSMMVNMYNNTISNLVTIIVHEFTHAGQVKTDKHTEYRKSYIEPNLEKFLTKLYSNETDDSFREQLYLSQPQEIAAYANQAVAEVSHKIHNLSPKQQVQAIDLILKNIQNTQADSSIPSITSKYKTISQNGKKEMKMYHRFLKLFYQELQSYKEIIVNY